jgi:hypothetical protein
MGFDRITLLLVFIISGFACSDGTDVVPTTQYKFDKGVITESRMPGEYIVTAEKGANHETLKGIFETYVVKSIKDIGRERYLIKLEKDPGPEIIEQEGLRSKLIKSVQPNFLKAID